MQHSITTCLSFTKNGEEAIGFYIDIFNKTFGNEKGASRILKITLFGDDELKDLLNVPDVPKELMPGPVGSVKTIRFLLNGQEFIAVNGGGYFGKFHESISLNVICDNQQQIDTLHEALAVNGQLQPCGWVKDRFGISWQITPNFLWEMDEDDDKTRSLKVMKALYDMNKIDVENIKEIWNSYCNDRLKKKNESPTLYKSNSGGRVKIKVCAFNKLLWWRICNRLEIRHCSISLPLKCFPHIKRLN